MSQTSRARIGEKKGCRYGNNNYCSPSQWKSQYTVQFQALQRSEQLTQVGKKVDRFGLFVMVHVNFVFIADAKIKRIWRT